MNSTDREVLVFQLMNGLDRIRTAVQGLTDAQATTVLSGRPWSILGILEHLGLAEEQMFRVNTERRRPAAANTLPRKVDQMIVESGPDRSRKFEALEVSHPNGKFQSLSDALESFEASRRQTVRYVETCEDDLRSFSAKHAFAGVIDCHQMFLIMSMHSVRHALQIEEIRKDPAFPS